MGGVKGCISSFQDQKDEVLDTWCLFFLVRLDNWCWLKLKVSIFESIAI